MKFFSWILMLGMSIVIIAAFIVPGAKSFQQPELARIIFFHVPCAIIGSLFYFGAGWFGFKYIKSKKEHWAIRCGACLEMSCLLAALTLVTGMLFSRVQWGAWWQWDPRQTSYLMTFFMLLAALSLKTSIKDPQKQASAISSYALISLVPVIFLIFIFPRLPHLIQTSFHPSQTLLKGELDLSYSWILRGMALILFAFCTLIFQGRVKVELLEKQLEDLEDDRNMESTSNHSTITSVDNTISLS